MPDEGLISSRTKSPYEGKTLVDNLRELGISDHDIANHLRSLHEKADDFKKHLGEPLHEKSEHKEGALEEGARAVKESKSQNTNASKMLSELDKQ